MVSENKTLKIKIYRRIQFFNQLGFNQSNVNILHLHFSRDDHRDISHAKLNGDIIICIGITFSDDALPSTLSHSSMMGVNALQGPHH